MTNGEYLKDRWMEGMVADVCKVHEINHQVFSDGWVHRLERDGRVRVLCGYKSDLNLAGASEIASDKVACYELLASQNVPAVSHTLLRMNPTTESFTWYHPPVSDMVVKPINGTGGRFIHRSKEQSAVEDWCAKQTGIYGWAISPHFDVTREIRMIVCESQVILAYEKLTPAIDDEGLKLFNLGHGATAHDIDPTEVHVQIAMNAMKALGLGLAAVDLIETSDGETLVLEVNSGFMMEHYMRSGPAFRENGYALYEHIILSMMRINT